MTIDDTVINKIAKLSSLKIEEDKKETLKAELEEIVAFVENLNEIDVSHVDATFTTIQGGATLREDEVSADSTIATTILNNAPKSDNGYFIVPKIIE